MADRGCPPRPRPAAAVGVYGKGSGGLSENSSDHTEAPAVRTGARRRGADVRGQVSGPR